MTAESFNAWKISFDEEMRQLQAAALHRSLGGSAAVARQDLLDEALHNRYYEALFDWCIVGIGIQYACMYVFMYVCMYVCLYIDNVYPRMYAISYRSVCMQLMIVVYVCMYVCMYVLYVRTLVYVCMYV